MKYNFDKVVDRKGTDSIKWEKVSQFVPDASEDVLPLWVADMDFPCSPVIIDAIKKRADKQIFGYCHSSNDAFLNSVTAWFARRFDWSVPQESIVYSPGIVPALGFLTNILTKENENIVVQRPVYHPFSSIIENNNRRLVNNALHYENGDYTMDLDDLEDKFKLRATTTIFFCSPHNPSGRVWSVEELTAFVALCKKYDICIISDEIHSDLVRKDLAHTPLEKIDPSYKHKIITCTSPSKSFNLAGLQISNIIIHDESLRVLWNEFAGGRFGMGHPNAFALTACQVAYNEAEDWLDQVNVYIDANFDYIARFLREKLPQIKLIDRQGTYLAWLDMNAYKLSNEALRLKIVKEANLAFNDGYIFGEEGSGFQRINLACPRSLVEKCMISLEQVFSALEK